jgi:hypothetical protein
MCVKNLTSKKMKQHSKVHQQNVKPGEHPFWSIRGMEILKENYSKIF